MRAPTLLCLATLWVGCSTPTKTPANKNKAAGMSTASPGMKASGATIATPEELGRRLVQAIHKGDEKAAFKLLPTRSELKALGAKGPSSEEGYKKLLAKNRRGFARVVAKFRRKYPAGCKTLVFSRLIKKDERKVGKADGIGSIDLFANCDGKEIWLADPDFLIKTTSGWKLMEFS